MQHFFLPVSFLWVFWRVFLQRTFGQPALERPHGILTSPGVFFPPCNEMETAAASPKMNNQNYGHTDTMIGCIQWNKQDKLCRNQEKPFIGNDYPAYQLMKNVMDKENLTECNTCKRKIKVNEHRAFNWTSHVHKWDLKRSLNLQWYIYNIFAYIILMGWIGSFS